MFHGGGFQAEVEVGLGARTLLGVFNDGSMQGLSAVLLEPRGDGFAGQLRSRIEEREAVAFEKYEGRFVGVTRILAMDPTDSPRTREPRRNPTMRIAAKHTGLRIQSIYELKEFERDHAEARDRWRAGDREVVFPAGTWWMKHFTPARVQKPPEPSWMN